MRLRSITTGTIATVLVVGLLGTPAAATKIETPIPAPEIGEEFAEVSFAVVGDMDGVHRHRLRVASERRPAEAAALGVVGPPGGAVGAAGAIAAGAGGIDRGAGGERLQRCGLFRRAGDLEVTQQAGREGDSASGRNRVRG